jgi:divinyl chlorophyllide a 8-vinyl-reductase
MVNQRNTYRYLFSKLFMFAIGASNFEVVHSYLPALVSHGYAIRTSLSPQTTTRTFRRRALPSPVTSRFKTNVHNGHKAHMDSSEITTTTNNNNNNDINENKTVVIAGATGYIGRAVVQESIKRGYNTVALVRNETWLICDDRARLLDGNSPFYGAIIKECNVQDPDEIKTVISSLQVPSVDAIISCLASPSGTKKDVYAIDYQATLNCLQAGQHVNARHFVLLSAFCCRNPLLQLQQAKLQLEAQLASQSIMTWSVVRPTAYFKSISGQLDAIRAGSPYVLFGDGAVTRCNPIAESELAEFMLDCLVDESKCQQILNVGGPDQPLTNQMLGEVSVLTSYSPLLVGGCEK